MNQENGQTNEKRSEKKGADTPPVSITHAAESHKDTPKGAEHAENPATLHQISRIDRLKKWACQITIAEVAMSLLTGVIAVSSFYYTQFAERQWQVMQRQLNDAEAAQSAELVIEEFNPAVFMEGATIHIFGSIRLRNVGVTTAKEISIKTGSGLSSTLPNYPPRTAEPNIFGPSLAAGGSIQTGHFDVATDKDLFLNSKTFYHIAIFVSYRNVFKVPMIVSDCRAYSAENREFVSCKSGLH